ncbi:glycosyltransferase family 1 protein [Pedobacter sp. MC2016-14]|uniref:glycosyltransferase family 1 protein n=1 Tax=Pedobacter sp. MC2016-14 TaxID=2897327 RepID=UPI001E572B7A|nr:glycosyltransferase family 1 protein [Pedobacter sp. MC2016-14]MCD0486936.1 glycosyltransferase family 1 protein [Pedobacter sp. MC2016-14]
MKTSYASQPKNLICFSHLRWDFVYQRPQHLLSRFAADANVYYVEEPLMDAESQNFLTLSKRSDTLTIVIPHIIPALTEAQQHTGLTALLDQLFTNIDLDDSIFWYYTPMALNFTAKYKPRLLVYDCMDELSAFKFAPPTLIELEKKLMAKADLVFTGGHSLYEAKKQQHANIFPFPSSIEKEHFAQSRSLMQQPADQAMIEGRKIGFYGVLDERFDIELIAELATKRPEWQLILIGPVVKIHPESLPKNKNIHYLGMKTYNELPEYLSGWDVAMIPFYLNESTRFISPTKTPEYLAAGIPVVSTPIRDVVKPYGVKKLVYIGSSCDEFIEAIDTELHKSCKKAWLHEVDEFLAYLSWDNTHAAMQAQMRMALTDKVSIAS